jgi:Zn-dependent peptidase ImmA (M78 family)
MKKFPKKISVLGRSYKVKFLPFEKLTIIAGEESFACVDYSNHVIFIAENLSEYEKMISLFHEMAHICQITVGLNQVISPDLQEIICESMANSFADLVRSLNGKRN